MPSNSLASISQGSRAPVASGSPSLARPLGLAEDDELEGAVVVAVLLSPDGRVMAQRRTVVGGG
jgi:hypothetical protein